MVIKYKNDVEELIDLNLLTVKLSKKKWLRNNLIPVIYSIISIIVCISVIIFYGGFAPRNKILIYVIVLCNALFWVRVLLASRTVYRKSVLRMLRKNPAYGQNKEVTRKPKEFYVQNLDDKSKSYSIKIKDVSRVIRKDDYLIMYDKDYTPLLMFPNKLLKGNLGEEEFFKGLKIEDIK
ncbi:hypothetical protein HMPREF1092_03049 [Clostridium thermobutyricum]|uniref:YcxB-like protein domain-containing protein n=1 Tax=Clostridium thermobutyricum TaxID=29372 RepID=N9XJN2_9CLOT|nr:hypothetical protein [Clostridium thermobutyricum]ENY99912.1 hypothetical protein HMPREF1092_03049 [Clostridium thermobutyricum]